MVTETKSTIDPTIQPYLTYGLTEAQKMYQGGGPKYYGGPTYVSPSTSTNTGLQALEARASLGNPLLASAQKQLQGTVSGDFLSGNPFFQGAFQPAARAAQGKFLDTMGDISSKASLAGRYGSGAMGTLQDRAAGIFGQSLADTAGSLAYKNYADERARQEAATLAAPEMAGADYQDIQNLLKAGQAREAYTGAQQKSDIEKFNFLQNQPQQNISDYLSMVYGNPLGKVGSSTTSGSADTSTLQNILGAASVAGGLYKNTGGTWLNNLWSPSSAAGDAYNAATTYAATSPTGWLDF
jgi:hypothetical protein